MPSTLKFAIVREDANTEATICEVLGVRKALLVASGGCTLLELARRFPDLELTGFDINPLQLEQVRRKMERAGAASPAEFNVGDDSADNLNQLGEFEALFRVLRHFLEEFVSPPEKIRRFFDQNTSRDERIALVESWFASPYWPAAFHVTFNTPFLNAMFGPAATQHAPRDSYPGYFQGVFEDGLLRENAAHNPFLQHVLCGAYLPGDEPPYINSPCDSDIELIEGTLLDVPDLASFDLISLSNIFDWSDDALVEKWATHLKNLASPGCAILIRQLNNTRDLRPFFEPEFVFAPPWSAKLLEMDRSLFYNRIEVARRAGGER